MSRVLLLPCRHGYSECGYILLSAFAPADRALEKKGTFHFFLLRPRGGCSAAKSAKSELDVLRRERVCVCREYGTQVLTDGLFSPSAAGAAQCLSVHSPTASLAICTSNAASGSAPPGEAKMAAAPAT